MPDTSTLTEQELIPNGSAERRFYPRVSPVVAISVPVVGTVAQLLDISENGLSILAQGDVTRDTVSRLSLPLNGLAKPIEVTARVVWTAESQKHAGIQLLNLSDYDREQIRKWQAQETSTGSNTELISRAPSEPRLEKEKVLTATPLLATKNSAQAPIYEDSGRHDTVERPEGKKTYNEVALAICGVLLAVLCVAVAVLIGYTASKSENRSASMGSTNNAKPLRARRQTPPAQDGSNEVANAAVPNIPSSEQTSLPDASLPDAGAQKQIRGNFPVVTETEKVRKTRSVPQNEVFNNSNRASESKFPANRATMERRSERSSNSNSPSIDEVTREAATELESRAAIPNTAVSKGAADNGASRSYANNTAANGTNIPTSSGGDVSRSTINSSPNPEDRNANADRSLAGNTAIPTLPNHSSGSSVTSRSISTAPESSVFKITPPAGHSSIVTVPGERVLESAAARVQIQRMVFVPDERKWWWPLHRSKQKEVRVGELISHVDPPPSRLPLRGAHRVRVRALVDRDGRVVDLRPVSGAVELMPVVMRAVRQWRYQPTYVDEIPVETEANVTVEFRPSTDAASR